MKLSALTVLLFSASILAWSPGELIPHKFVPQHHGTKGDWMPDLFQIVNGSNIVLIAEGTTNSFSGIGCYDALVIHGTLEFNPAANCYLQVGTIMLESNGVLRIRPQDRSVTHHITYNGTIKTNEDPAQLMHGLYSNGGTIDIAGTEIASPIVTTPLANAGATNIEVGSTDGWLLGDELVFPDQQTVLTNGPNYWAFQYQPQIETRFITAIVGNTVMLSSALAYNHGQTWIGHLTRNVVIEGATNGPRAHMMFAGHIKADVKWAVFRNMGRTTTEERHDTKFNTNGVVTQIGTNQRGRYVLHAHHAHEPFHWEGNVILGSDRLALVNHNSRGTITRNIVVGAKGSGIFMEDGVEMGTVTGNLVVGSGGGTGLSDDVRFGTLSGEDLGAGGFAIWARGPLIRIENNIAAGFFNQAAFAYFTHSQFITAIVPDIEGNPPNLIGQYVFVPAMPIHAYGSFSGNTFLGMAKNGLEISYQQTPNGTRITNNSIRLLSGDGKAFQAIHCNEVILDNCALSSIGTIGWGAHNNNGTGGKLTMNGGVIAGHYIGVIGFPQGGTLNGVTFQSNTWNLAVLSGAPTDLLGYVGGNWRIYPTNQNPNLTKVWGHAVEMP